MAEKYTNLEEVVEAAHEVDLTMAVVYDNVQGTSDLAAINAVFAQLVAEQQDIEQQAIQAAGITQLRLAHDQEANKLLVMQTMADGSVQESTIQAVADENGQTQLQITNLTQTTCGLLANIGYRLSAAHARLMGCNNHHHALHFIKAHLAVGILPTVDGHDTEKLLAQENSAYLAQLAALKTRFDHGGVGPGEKMENISEFDHGRSPVMRMSPILSPVPHPASRSTEKEKLAQEAEQEAAEHHRHSLLDEALNPFKVTPTPH